MNLTALGVKLFSYGISNGAADAARNNRNSFKSVGFGCSAEGTYKIMKPVTLIEVVKLFRGCSDNLENNCNRTPLPVKVRYSERDSFSVFINPENDKLTRLCFFGNKRSSDFHQTNRGVEHLLCHYFKHT